MKAATNMSRIARAYTCRLGVVVHVDYLHACGVEMEVGGLDLRPPPPVRNPVPVCAFALRRGLSESERASHRFHGCQLLGAELPCLRDLELGLYDLDRRHHPRK
jgi:hypothetical protein